MNQIKFNNSKNSKELPQNTLRDYFILIRNNIIAILLITSVIISGATYYAITEDDVYVAKTTLKINKPKGSVLENVGMTGEFDAFRSNRFIANEIVVMNNITIQEQVAREIIDSFKVINRPSDFKMIYQNPENPKKNDYKLKSYRGITGILNENVEIMQKEGLDFIEIYAESSSPREAALIANSYANAYRKFNLLDNRQQVTNVKNFLYQERENRLKDLVASEDQVKSYKLKQGAVKLDKQASSIIDQITEFESRKNAIKIELSILKEQLNELNAELKRKDPSMAQYLMNKSAEPYLERIQDEIARIQAQKTIALANNSSPQNAAGLSAKYDNQIKALKEELNKKLNEFTNITYSSSPDEIKKLTAEIFNTRVKYQSNKASFDQLNAVINDYESKFNALPSRTLELARLERERMSDEKLYTLIEEKYQEALINEQSITGNVLIMNNARIPSSPVKPRRAIIISAAALFGIFLGFVFVYVRNYFDRSIKSPDDLIDNGYNVLTWIPKIKAIEKGSKKGNTDEIIVHKTERDFSGESFKTLRNRISISKLSRNLQTLLVTSSVPGEGKTFIASNLAVSFALSNKRTLILDCDLRKPRIHKAFKIKNRPGMVDYFFGKADYESIFQKTSLKNITILSAGAIPPNPSEIINSNQFKTFLLRLREEFDYIIIDSPPVMAVSDSEILSQLVDASILVANSGETEIDWVDRTTSLLDNNTFIGIVVNRFNYKHSYNTYYKHYGYYQDNYGAKINKKDIHKRKLQKVQ